MAGHANVTKQLVNYVRAGYPGIWMRTSEEARAVSIIQKAANEIGKIRGCAAMNVFLWSFTEGYHGSDNGIKGAAERKPDEALALIDPRAKQHLPADSIVVLKDFSPFLEDVGVLRTVRDLMGVLKDAGSVIIFLGPVPTIKPEIEKDVLTLELPLPDAEEFGDMLNNLVANNAKLKAQGSKLFTVPREKVLDGLAGLTLTEAENVLALTIVQHGTFEAAALKSET